MIKELHHLQTPTGDTKRRRINMEESFYVDCLVRSVFVCKRKAQLASINLSCCHSHWWRWCSQKYLPAMNLFFSLTRDFFTRMHFRSYSHASLRASLRSCYLTMWHCEIATGRQSRVRNFRAASSEKYAPFLLDTELELLQSLRPREKKGVKLQPNHHESSKLRRCGNLMNFARPVRVFVYWGYAGWSASQVCFAALCQL